MEIKLNKLKLVKVVSQMNLAPGCSVSDIKLDCFYLYAAFSHLRAADFVRFLSGFHHMIIIA